MNFSVYKCKVKHMGKNNLNYMYKVLHSELVVTTQERDLELL